MVTHYHKYVSSDTIKIITNALLTSDMETYWRYIPIRGFSIKSTYEEAIDERYYAIRNNKYISMSLDHYCKIDIFEYVIDSQLSIIELSNFIGQKERGNFIHSVEWIATTSRADAPNKIVDYFCDWIRDLYPSLSINDISNKNLILRDSQTFSIDLELK